MELLLLALVLLCGSGLIALALGRHWRWAMLAGVVGCVGGCGLGMVPAVQVLAGRDLDPLRLPWPVPYGEFFLSLDALSAWFLLPILALPALSAIYGTEYLKAWQGRKCPGACWFFYNLLVASMVLVVLARNAILFLIAWEVMALASFFLVTFEDEKESVREAGWIYLVATHLGTAFLLVLFILLGNTTGSLDFEEWSKAGSALAPQAGLLFVLALIGFGVKAGFIPLHVWLPEAHPAAPSQVSAVMSGVMIKTGLYGLLRLVTVLGPPPVWWGGMLVGVGLFSGVLGVLFALAQHDLKRLLAYHSVENIGIIALGLGLGLLGISVNQPALAVLGLAGGLLHVVNHALFKGLLFLGAGSVAHGTGTRDLEHLGGLWKRMPWTGGAFLIGSMAIAGLPPLNGFLSEFLIFLGGLRGALSGVKTAAAAGLVAVAGLGLISGLAAACFAKAFGIVFLGEPRTDHAAHAHEAGAAMRGPMWLLAGGCVLIGLLGAWLLPFLGPVISTINRLPLEETQAPLLAAAKTLRMITLTALGLIGLALLLGWWRQRLLVGRPVAQTVTWDCGYAQPTARMQYTASSFAQPLTALFHGLLGTKRQGAPPQGLFPRAASLATHTPDFCRGHLFHPAFERVGGWMAKLRWLQHGNVQLYVLYIALTLLALLVWKLM